MKALKLKYGMVCISVLLITSCAQNAKIVIETKPDPVAEQLLQMAERIEAQWQVLSNLKEKQQKQIITNQDEAPVHQKDHNNKRPYSISKQEIKGLAQNKENDHDLPTPLQTRLTFQAIGRPERMLRVLAKKIGVRYEIQGYRRKDLTPIIIAKTDVSAGEVLEEIGNQLGDEIGILVKPDPGPYGIKLVLRYSNQQIVSNE